ncbi:hypothetical protein [Thioclava sp. F28-4]|uniref:hypothetical protein n=1 Tax=Thioclava sp. F28-4 TaxID=1915315 RepID=UPI0011BA9FD7|nr:hypothetical protein [Thioclava sp. F28-4]
MLEKTFSAVSALLLGFLPCALYADEPYMPYMDPEGASPREIICRIADHGKIYHNGTCYFQAREQGSFTIVTGNAKYAASVDLVDREHALGLWTEEAYASHMHGRLHELNRSHGDRACWEDDELSICAW